MISVFNFPLYAKSNPNWELLDPFHLYVSFFPSYISMLLVLQTFHFRDHLNHKNHSNRKLFKHSVNSVLIYV
ncbi:hypothetical protein PRUPE_8G245100 [Prunus persica]|uniref:Uncharacterized protein n=1 Tax=Prunus persica TaxID=3760 RepID=M5VLC0_PRUPE|nr:hypothetical protein PRUPE_8G245100 [Prunus persica]